MAGRGAGLRGEGGGRWGLALLQPLFLFGQNYIAMKKRTKLNLSNYLNDLQLIEPDFFREDLHCTGRTLPSNPRHPSSAQMKSPRKFTLKKSPEQGDKRTSLEKTPLEEYSQSAKEKLRGSEGSGGSEGSQSMSTNSITQITAVLPSLLTSPKNRTEGRRKNKFELKEIIKRQKISNICSKFIEKMQRNVTNAPAIDYQGFQKKQRESFLHRQGYEINRVIDHSLAFLSIIQIGCLFFSYTLAIVFTEVEEATFIGTLQFFSIGFYLLEIVYNCLTVKANAGKKLITFQQILRYYLQTNMIVDILSLMILLVDCSTAIAGMQYLRLLIIAKLPQCLEKMEKLEAFFIKNYYHSQYWSLIKVVLFNFCFAHILAICLSAMAGLNSQTNWQTVKGISDCYWFQRYTWAYYWGTTVMLTIGFGDIVATNYQQALCLIVIEIFSVMCLAYNINSVGTLISNIRSQDIEKSKNYKTFKQLSDKYELSNELEWKINHYIEESVNIRKKFNLEEENSFLQKLPSDLKKDYLKESNRSIFYHLTFFGNLVDKTLYAFAENIEMSISHPQQTLRRFDDEYNLLILRQGEIGFTSKRRNCNFNDMIIDRVKVTDVKRPFLLGLQFLTRRRPVYEIKSLEYSVIYYLEYDNLIKNLKESQMDYHHYCFLRDKNKSVLDEFQVYPCEYCPGKHHTKFTCPRLHFIPLKQLVIYKEQAKERNNRNQRKRQPQLRLMGDRFNSLRNFRAINKITQEQTARKNAIRKPSNPFLEQLSQMKRIQNETKHMEMGSTSEQLFLKYTSEVIRVEFNRFKILENFEDEVWTLSCDKMKNYKDYFPENNPCAVEDRYSLEERRQMETENESFQFITANSPSLASFHRTAAKLSSKKLRSHES